jgi:hypothetical protein
MRIYSGLLGSPPGALNVINVIRIAPNSGHWIMDENPQANIKLVTEFLAK